MSMKELKKAFDFLENDFMLSELDFCGRQSLDTISKDEKALNIKFCETYKAFLEKYGCGGFFGVEIYGIIKDEEFNSEKIPPIAVPNVVWTTLQWHKDYNHPIYLPIIYSVGEGTTYCLDTSQMNAEGECPVVAWPLGGYETTPVLEVVAPDFGTFFLNLVEREIQWKKEREAGQV